MKAHAHYCFVFNVALSSSPSLQTESQVQEEALGFWYKALWFDASELIKALGDTNTNTKRWLETANYKKYMKKCKIIC